MAYEVNTGGSGAPRRKPHTWEELIADYRDPTRPEGYYDEYGYHQAPAPWAQPQEPAPEPIKPEEPEETKEEVPVQKRQEAEPIVEPVTEEKKQTEEEAPVVQPVTTSASFVDEDVKARREVPPEDTASGLYENWTEYINQNEPDEEGWFYQQEPEKGGNLVTPVGYKGSDSNSGTSNSYYGTGGRTDGETSFVNALAPAYSDTDIDTAIQFMRNDLGIMEFDPVAEREYAEQLLNDGVVPGVLPAETTPPATERLNPSISDFDLLMDQPQPEPERITPNHAEFDLVMPETQPGPVSPQLTQERLEPRRTSGPSRRGDIIMPQLPYADDIHEFTESLRENLGRRVNLPDETHPAPATPQLPGAAYARGATDWLRDNFALRVNTPSEANQPPIETPSTSGYYTGPEINLGNDPLAQYADLFEPQIEPEPETQPTPTQPVISGNPLREAIDRVNAGDLRTTDITRGHPVDTVTETPVDIRDVDPTRRFEREPEQKPYDPYANMSTYDEFVPPEQMLFPTDYGSTHPFTGEANPVGAELLGNLEYLIESNSGQGGDVARENAIDEMIFANGGDPYDPGLRDRIGKLIDQINADDAIDPFVERPLSGERTPEDYIRDVENFYENIPDVTGPALDKWASDFAEQNRLRNEADARADELGIYPGDPRYDKFIEDYVNERMGKGGSENQPGAPATTPTSTDRWFRPENTDSSAYANALYDQMREAQRDSYGDIIDKYPDSFEYRPDLGIWTSTNRDYLLQEYPKEYYRTEDGRIAKINPTDLSWQDAVGRDRLMDDLMQMNAPGIMDKPIYDADGNPITLNTAAQALYLGMNPDGTISDTSQYGEKGALGKDQWLHLFDKGGSFYNPESGLNLDPAFADIVANDASHARRYPELAETAYLTQDQYDQKVDAFIKANPLIRALLDAGMITMDDIANKFFKNVVITQGRGSGSGYGSGYRGYGGGGGGGGGYGSYGYGDNSAKKQEEQRINNIMKNWSF